MALRVRDWRVPLLTAGALLFARLSYGPLPYFLLYTSAGLLLLGFLWAHRTLRSLAPTVKLDVDHLQVGEHAVMTLLIANRSHFPITWIEVENATPQQVAICNAALQATEVPPLGQQELQLPLTVRRRGHFHPGPIRITTGDPFGLFRGRIVVQSPQWITVYPRIHHLEGLRLPVSQPFGPIRSRTRALEDPSNQAEIRQYRPGDNPRYIHWRTTARMGTLMLREFEMDAATRVLILPDMAAEAYRSTGADEDAVETVVEVAASLAALCLRQRIEFQLAVAAQERFVTTPGRGERPYRDALEMLARMEAQGQIPVEQVLEQEAARLSGRATLVLITPHLTSSLAERLVRLQPRHQVMLILLEKDQTLTKDASHLARQLADRGAAVYRLRVGDEIANLAEYQVPAGQEVRG